MLAKDFVFTHDSFIDPGWAPGPGEHYSDAPKATMRVHKVDSHTVWYGYSVGKRISGWRMDREDFESRYYQGA